MMSEPQGSPGYNAFTDGRRSVITNYAKNDFRSLSRRSGQTDLNSQYQSVVSLVRDKHEVIKLKQERDLDRWKRKLQMEKEKSDYNLRKERSIEETLEMKSKMALDF